MDLKNLTICVDAGWSSRRHANECCFIVIDNKTKLLYDIIVITRDVFSGASGNMEAEAAKYFCEKHKEKINLVGVVKDGDTKLAKIFEAAWNRVNILKDSNHLLKILEKIFKRMQISNVLKIYDFPPLNIIDKKYLREIKNKIQDEIENYLNILSKNIKIVEEKLNSNKMNKKDELYWIGVIVDIANKKIFFLHKKVLLHQNNSEYVQESEIENQNSFSITPQLIELNEIIDVLSDRSEELFQAGSTNRCESFMNSRTKFIEKRFNSSKQWEMRCQFSVLNRELPEWKTILMAQLGLNINLPQIISQAKKNLEKQYEKIRQNTQEYKTGRTKTLNINEGEFNGDIEIFKEVDDNVDTNEFVEENFDKNDLSDDNEMEEIEEILSSNNIISNDLTDDNIFGITFDKRLPSSFTDNTLLFEIERNKKK
ncbi:hypothetical protein M0813_01918 [Anaeramoeba flamelloides]|uniref:Uncharacterized protein n=1 Tax=Anaeramoeba flamelloides TaxID=1746091 RepID=A0ABQ8YPY3_9EUKA|nr:hypothetical protein M0813_01918 [Anaeramoeba flamelloides]